MILGGSTNAVLHLIAIAHSIGITLTVDDFARVSDATPFLANLRPSGKYVMEDLGKIGGVPSMHPFFLFLERHNELYPAVLHYLLKNKYIDGNTLTVTGKTLGENLERWVHKYGELSANQDIIRPLKNPLKPTGHIR
jgi:dihydroxy-acid dehydratase